jgi:hypothetical protein
VGWLIGKTSDSYSGNRRLASQPLILTEVFHGFPHVLQKEFRDITSVKPWQFLLKEFSVHHSRLLIVSGNNRQWIQWTPNLMTQVETCSVNYDLQRNDDVTSPVTCCTVKWRLNRKYAPTVPAFAPSKCVTLALYGHDRIRVAAAWKYYKR